MACNYPAQAYRVARRDRSGNVLFHEVVFKVARGDDVVSDLRVPCGQCDGCRLERARQWAVRCVHEAQMHDRNCFITLTYNDENVPAHGDLVYRDFQLFMKRLRKKFGKNIRFFMCGEYGERRERPHFHACLFGIDFDDRVYFKTSASGSKVFTSATLQSLWSDRGGGDIGFATVGELNFDSAGYVARYVMKKARGGSPREEICDLETGELYFRTEEFTRMSLKPGIGRSFFDRWRSDLFPKDVCVIDGVAMKPPRFYSLKLKESDPELYEELAYKRACKALVHAADNTPERLEVKERVLKAKAAFLKRELR